MESFNENLDKYAELTIKVGINIQPGQTLVVMAGITTADFVRKLTKKAYEAGAKNVIVDWSDEELTLIKYLNAPEDAFKEYPMWRVAGFEQMAKEGSAFLSIHAANPDLLKDVDPQRIATANKTSATAMKDWREYISNGRVNWSIVSVPTKDWSAKVFPGLNEEEQIEKLWESIFRVTRVDTDNPVEAWKSHIENLDSKAKYLNQKKYKKLHYKAPGTDLTIELPQNQLWISAGMENEKGTYFVPNIPTEEVFTAPLKEGVNGTVTSTKPLNYGGNLIENFTLTFENGKIVDFIAEIGYETLKRLIDIDEGSHFLGEIALVPYDSPISNSNIIFYNTLFDENASCHLAIGNAYPLCIEGGTKMTNEELQQHGLNISLSHVDFMIGSAELNIDGETVDGKIEAVFRNGNWAV